MVQGVKVERATVRTTLTPWAATARLCLGRRRTGWEPTTLTTKPPALANGPASIPESERPRRRHVFDLRMPFLLRPSTQRTAGRGQPGRRQEAGRAAEAARARAVRGP